MNLFDLLWAIRYLRLKQIGYWIWRKCQFKILYPIACRLRGKPVRYWPRKAPVDIVPKQATIIMFRRVFARDFHHLRQPLDWDQLREMQANRFTFLNRKVEINPQNWDHRYHSHLWNFHLHYFDYAVWAARAFVEDKEPAPMHQCKNLIQWWIKLTDVGRGDGWEPYPISLRIVNWIYAYALVAEHYDDQVFLGRWRASIYQQLEFLSSRLEHHVLGNHLVKNVKALIIGYLFFDKRDRLPKWEKLLWQQFEEQILNDGGHYERAPMYHAQVLADLLECFALLHEFKCFPPSGDVQRCLLLMARFLDEMTLPDGTFAQFNDSACTEGASPWPILQSASAICGYKSGKKKGEFRDTGYFVWDSNDGTEMIVIDAGPPSVDHIPAHVHCDMLSYELWLCGQQFITDSGVHGYGGDPYREYCRSTRAHNTVTFDGVEQSRVWGTFRLGKRAKLIRAQASGDSATFTFEGEYLRYDRKLIHRRHITRRFNDKWKVYEWMIEDIAAKGRMDKATSYIHLHPSWSAKELKPTEFNKRQVLCESGSNRVLIEAFAEEKEPDPEEDVAVTIVKGKLDPIQGWFFPDFGEPVKNHTICFDFFVRRGDKFGYKIRVIR